MTYDTNWTEVLNTLSPPPSETPLIPCQHGWEFEFKDIPYETVTTEVTLSLTYYNLYINTCSKNFVPLTEVWLPPIRFLQLKH